MKKSIGYMSLSLMLCLTILFVGCGNTARSLARNIDSTVTNLIYSVSSLDWADSSTLSNISGNKESTYDSSLNFYEGYNFAETENLDNNYLINKNENIEPIDVNNANITAKNNNFAENNYLNNQNSVLKSEYNSNLNNIQNNKNINNNINDESLNNQNIRTNNYRNTLNHNKNINNKLYRNPY